MLFSPLFSGSSGNCSFLEAGKARVLVDAGLAGKQIEAALRAINVEPGTLSAILVTHEHIDHVRAVGVLSRRYKVPVYANAACFTQMERSIGELLPSCCRIFETGCDFYIGELNVTPFKISHDAVEPVGYTFSHKGRSVGLLTDTGRMYEHLYDAVSGLDLLLLEANHDIDMLKSGPYPEALKKRILSSKGHLSNEAAGKTLLRLYERGLRHAVLGHLSAQNTDETLAMSTVEEILKSEGASMRLALAHRDRPCAVFHLE